jgi:hypothetical protein
VFFVLSENKTFRTRIAYHIKIPYASDNLNIFNNKTDEKEGTHFEAYKGTYKTIYCVKNLDNITYFRSTNNLLTYEKKTNGEIAIFVPDFLNASYKLVRFGKINIINKSEHNLLVRTAKGKLYFVSLDVLWNDNKRYIAVIDVNSGKPLFMASKEDETKSELLHIIDKKILPIIQFKKQNISIYLLDLSRDKVDVISWELNNIHQLITRLLRLAKAPADKKNEITKDTIKYFYVQDDVYAIVTEYSIRDMNIEGKGKDLYVRSVAVYLDLIIEGDKYSYYLSHSYIKFELDDEQMLYYWDITNAKVNIYKKSYEDPGDKYKSYLYVQIHEPDNYYRMFKKSYKLIGQEDYKYVSTDLYENDCYYIQQHKGGIMIRYKKPNDNAHHYESSLLKYGKYLIIIQSQIYDKIAFIDQEKNLVYKFSIHEKQNLCSRYRFLYHYYPLHRENKLLFLSKDLQCLMIVDINKVEHFINLERSEGCETSSGEHKNEEHTNIEEVATVSDVTAMVIKAIENKHKIAPKPDSVMMLGHHIDENTKTLYIVAQYAIKDAEQVGVFAFNALNSELRFELSSFVTRQPQNIELGSLAKKHNNFKFVSNFKLYKIGFDRVNIGNLDIYYNDTSAFVSVRYNRFSFPITKRHYEKNKFVVESIDNLIIMKYGCSYMSDVKKAGREYAEISCKSSYGFLICDLALVQKMPAVSIHLQHNLERNIY